MTLRYKLTDENGRTRNNTLWQEGVVYTTSGEGSLCGPGWLHCYNDPLVAIFMNPAHANFQKPKMCEVECSGQNELDNGLKEGWTSMAFVRWVDVPIVTTTHRIALAILCAKQGCSEPQWVAWADRWLSGQDRTRHAATATTTAAAYAANAADADYADADAADYAAANAANAAATAAYASKLDLPAIAKEAMQYV